MATKHTPGPWACEKTGDGKRFIIGDNQSSWGTHVAEVHRDDIDRDEAEANARLIQNAPEMLDALWSLMAAYGAFDGRNGNSGECWDKARAALAKINPERPVR